MVFAIQTRCRAMAQRRSVLFIRRIQRRNFGQCKTSTQARGFAALISLRLFRKWLSVQVDYDIRRLEVAMAFGSILCMHIVLNDLSLYTIVNSHNRHASYAPSKCQSEVSNASSARGRRDPCKPCAHQV